ncbi:glycoside hydrolase family 16 protein [Clostridium sp. SHJSY1]|uniref:beta-glucanase n=1 Tax=Clostridium sp. SHJSY1 TaxID=2942483 RepID=UPI002875D862|nr:glycoside hydrolase family 16 protein [Clostridium sp. SHJSY1]MDS0525744.1 glycoside hydrolase family 16 protein [Clostridium sp. SHJSY1]
MNKRNLKILSLGIIISTLLTGTLPIKSSLLVSTHFADEFEYSNSKAWSKSNGWSNGGMFNCTWSSKNVNFNNSIMNLTLNKNIQSNTKPYAGSEYRTNDTYDYGIYQAKMKPAKNIGIVSSFFTYTGPSDDTPWDEIDIEFLGKDTTKVQFNYFTNGVGNHEYIYNLGFDASTSYHTYSFIWQPTYIAWLVDGVEVYRATDNIPSHPGRIIMNLWPGIGVDSWLGTYNGVTPITTSYDWITYDPFNTY